MNVHGLSGEPVRSPDIVQAARADPYHGEHDDAEIRDEVLYEAIRGWENLRDKCTSKEGRGHNTLHPARLGESHLRDLLEDLPRKISNRSHKERRKQYTSSCFFSSSCCLLNRGLA